MSINSNSMLINSSLFTIVEEKYPVSCKCSDWSSCDHQDLYKTISKMIPVSPEEATQLKSKGKNIYYRNDSGEYVLDSSSQSKQSPIPAQKTAEKVERCSRGKFCCCSVCTEFNG